MGRDQPPDERRTRFEQVATEVWGPLQRYVRRRAAAPDADDVVADVLTVVWRRLDDVPVGAEVPWSLQVARRCLANHHRSANRRVSLLRRLTAEPAFSHGPPERDLHDGDDRLAAAIALLPAADQEVLHLWAWEGLEAREIATVVGASANTASARLSRAKRRLAALLEQGARHDDRGGGHDEGAATRKQQR